MTVQLADGRREVERVDLPAGSMSLPDVERELERKVLREMGLGAGEARARAALEAGLRLESADPAEVLASLGR